MTLECGYQKFSSMGTIACVTPTLTLTPRTQTQTETRTRTHRLAAHFSKPSYYFPLPSIRFGSKRSVWLLRNPNFTTKRSSSMASPLQVHASSTIGLSLSLVGLIGCRETYSVFFFFLGKQTAR